MKRLYKILVTGTPISGKTNVARKLENDLLNEGLLVTNKDVDYDSNWREIDPASDVYLLQTPHSSIAEKEDGIKFDAFNRILYVHPDKKTQREFLKSRMQAWFEKGVIEIGRDSNPKPGSLTKIPGILKNVLGYHFRIPKLFREDSKFIEERGARLVIPILNKNGELDFINYSEELKEILGYVKGR